MLDDIQIINFKLNITIDSEYELYTGSVQYGSVLELKVSFKMGLFSDTKHTYVLVDVTTPFLYDFSLYRSDGCITCHGLIRVVYLLDSNVYCC